MIPDLTNPLYSLAIAVGIIVLILIMIPPALKAYWWWWDLWDHGWRRSKRETKIPR